MQLRLCVVVLAVLTLPDAVDVSAQSQPLTVRGATIIPSEQLASVVAALPRDAALDSLYAMYASRGNLGVTISLTSDTLDVVEGRRYAIGDVSITPDSLDATLRISGFDDSRFVDGAFSPERIDALLDAIVTAISSRGYPLAVARLASMNIDDTNARVAANIAIETGERVTVSDIDVEGNTETDRGLIIAAAAVRRGTPFTDDLARQVRARLVRLDLFSDVAEPQLYRTDSGGYGILVRVTEGNTNTFDGILGYQPPTSVGEQGSLTGHLNFQLRNPFGDGRRIAVRFERSKPSQLLEVRYGEPYLFRLPLDIEVGFRQRQELASFALPSYVQRSVNLDASYGFLDAWSVRGGGAYDETLPELDTTRDCATQLLNSSTLETSLGVAFDTRSNPINPTSGARLVTSVTVGSKSIRGAATCIDSLIPDSEFRQRIVADLEAYMSIAGPFVVAAGVHGGEIRGNFLEESDLFRMGGQSTVRGYLEDEFRVSRRLWSNVEARVILSGSSFVAAFIDGAYALRPVDQIRGTEAIEYWLLGYGVSAQIESPLGLVKFSFALSRDDSFDTGKVFVGLVNRF
ncbi:MAG: BamA/TamA family outer membrane protein [bacterium]|nr:BamA/TamA family outer membrane protein [Candidatus Kapabacteria bacterium]